MARSFNGSSDKVVTSSLPTLTSTITISVWQLFNVKPGPGSQNFVFQGDASGSFTGYGLYGTANGYTLEYTTGSNVFVDFTTTDSFDTGVWHNIVYSGDFTTAGSKIYKDGVSKSFSTSGTPGTPASGANNSSGFGAFSPASGSAALMNGRLAEIAIWNVKLTDGEVAALANGALPNSIRPSALKGFWPFDGLQSPEPDLSGFIQNGTLTGTSLAAGPPVMPFTRRGVNALFAPTKQPFGSGTSGSRRFNGSTDNIVATTSITSLAGVNYTLAVWVNFTAVVTAGAPFALSTSTITNGTTGFLYRGDSSGTGSTKSSSFYNLSGSGSFFQVDSARNETTGVWHHLAGVCDTAGTNLIFYIDGILIGNAAVGGSISPDTVSIGFIKRATSPLPFTGPIADAAMWSTNLTAAEISALAKGARPYQIRPLSLAGWWPLDGLLLPEPDLSGLKNNGTVTGTTPAPGPPIMQFSPRWPQQPPFTTVAPSFSPAWARSRNTIIEGVAT